MDIGNQSTLNDLEELKSLIDKIGAENFQKVQDEIEKLTAVSISDAGWGALAGINHPTRNPYDFSVPSGVYKMSPNPDMPNDKNGWIFEIHYYGSEVLLKAQSSQGGHCGSYYQWIYGSQTVYSGWIEHLTTHNTIVDANGFIKTA